MNESALKNIPPKKSDGAFRRSFIMRSFAIGLVFLIAAMGMGGRLFQLQILQLEEWRTRASENQMQSDVIAPMRGSIYDANMRELARSSLVWKVAIDAKTIGQSKLYNLPDTLPSHPVNLAAQEVARILGMDESTLYALFSDNTVRYKVLQEHVEKPQIDELRLLQSEYGLQGIILEENSIRRYPYGELLAPVLGFTGTDGIGAAGLEYQYNSILAGVPGRLISQRDKFGREIGLGEAATEYAAQDGYSLALTVDIDIQQSLEKNIATAVEKYSVTQRGMGIVMDVKTGAILGMATYPAFDPNDPYTVYDEVLRAQLAGIASAEERQTAYDAALYAQWRNKAVSDSYEPGSVFKIITAAAALDSGTYTMDSTFMCNGEIEVGEWTIGCAQGKSHGLLTLHDALLHSCNVSFVQIAAGVGAETWYDYVNAFGLTKPVGVDLPGEPTQEEIASLVYSLSQLGVTELASASFGQSNKYTALQMMAAASAAVNGGQLLQPYIVSKLLDADGNVAQIFDPQPKRQVLSQATSALVASALEDLVASPSGFGKNAYVAGYHVGGKSGTSEKLDVRQNEGRDAYISSFYAFAPANDPQVAVLIVLDEPTDDPVMGNFFGGRLAGPAAGSVIGDTLKILGIEPDYTEEELSRTTIPCPQLVELDLASAQVMLNQMGLSAKVIGSGGTVVAQYPESFMQVPRGGQVVLYTESAEMQNITVPDLLGQNAQLAIDVLRSLGFNVLTTGAPEGGATVVVEWQDLAADTEVPMGTVIQLTLQDMTSAVD